MSLFIVYYTLLGKCNSLLKKNQLKSFYTINGKLKTYSDSGKVSPVIASWPHDKDLLLEGSEKMNKVKIKHNQSTKMNKNNGRNNYFYFYL